MGNPAGVRRDFQELEERRLRAAELLRKGVHQAEVARQVGSHRQSVSRWAVQLRQGGVRALKRAGQAGRRARLRPEDLRRIEKGLKRGPERLGYETGLWTSWRVADLIERECRGEVPSCAGVADSATTGMELPASGRARARTRRRQDSSLETTALAGD
jgi:transposase